MAVIVQQCKFCRQQLKPFLKLGPGFMDVLIYVIEKVATSGTKPEKYGCTGQVKNPKYPAWEKLKKKYDEDMKKYEKEMAAFQKRQNTLIGRALGAVGRTRGKPPQQPKPIPPEPPKKIPCKNHYNKEAVGEYNEKIQKKKKKPLFLADGSPYPKSIGEL